MQPYAFPYVGYFQLAASVDRFVFFDDVDFIKRGWINRNRILLDGRIHPITIPVRHVDLGTKINKVHLAEERDYLHHKLLPTLKRAYCKAENFHDAFPVVEGILLDKTAGIGALAKASVRGILDYLGIRVDFVESSTKYENQGLRGQTRIIDICLREAATHYHNPAGGQDLYEEERFEACGLGLRFVQPKLHPYRQVGTGPFVPGLSILDLVLNVERREARNVVLEHDLTAPHHPLPSASHYRPGDATKVP
ncbi:MAG: WbqC family protein [Candidatus Thermoplasmatota archaeon]|jgi:hypothetical protein